MERDADRPLVHDLVERVSALDYGVQDANESELIAGHSPVLLSHRRTGSEWFSI